MEAEELRIGNWATVPRKKDKEVYAKPVQLGAIGRNTFGILEDGKSLVAIKDDLSPIPLTEEILLKAGFEKKGWQQELKMQISKYNILWWCDLGMSIICEGRSDHDDMVTFDSDCKYVHQLQNLYFALTGEELEIEL